MERCATASSAAPGVHWFRKGYYVGSAAELVCTICGLESSWAEVERSDVPALVPLRAGPGEPRR